VVIGDENPDGSCTRYFYNGTSTLTSVPAPGWD
jgi:hypothetical protein